MTDAKFDVSAFDVKEFDRILACGLSFGIGDRGGRVCIEAAICQVMGLPHGDDPGCVTESVRRFKIRLNDSQWSSPKARAKGLHDLGLAQLGSMGVVEDQEFTKRIVEKTIRVLIPALFRDVLKDEPKCLEAAKRCEDEGTVEAARNARDVARGYNAAYAADAAYAAAYAAYAAAAAAAYAAAAAAAAADAAYAADAADAAAAAAKSKYKPDYYLNLSAKLALETLRELKSPGIVLLDGAR